MSKILKGFGIAAVGLLALPLVTLAAADLTHITFDGRQNISVDEGDTVDAKVTYDLTSSTDVESLSWELVGSDLPETCVNIQDRIANGTFTTTFDIDTTGASEGTWDVTVRLFGDNGADASNLCENTDEVDEMTFTDRITVEDDTNDNQAAGDDDDDNSDGPSWFQDWLEGPFSDLLDALAGNAGSNNGGNGDVAACEELDAKMLGTQYGVYNSANVKLQGFLLSEGMSIPALSAGASFGFYGPQTAAAIAAFNGTNGCN